MEGRREKEGEMVNATCMSSDPVTGTASYEKQLKRPGTHNIWTMRQGLPTSTTPSENPARAHLNHRCTSLPSRAEAKPPPGPCS